MRPPVSPSDRPALRRVLRAATRRRVAALAPTLSLALTGLLAAGCGGGGGSSRGAQAAAAPVSSATAPAPVGSATIGAPSTGTAPGTAPAPGAGGTSGGAGGLPGKHQGVHLGRTFHLFAPQAAATPGRALRLAVFFHGSGDTAQNFFLGLEVTGWLAAAEAEDLLVVVPDTKSPFRTFPVWSGNPANDLAPMAAELAEVRDLLAVHALARYDVDLRQVHAAGFSDGGLFLACVGLADPTFATHTILGHGVGAGYVQPPARRGPVQKATGEQDRFFPAAEQAQAFLRAQGHDVRWVPVPSVGHSMTGLSRALGPASAVQWMTARPGPAPAGATAPPGAAPAPPAPPSAGPTGLVTRQATTTARPGLPATTFSYDLYVPTSYRPATALPLVVAANTGLAPWRALAEAEGVLVVDFRDLDRNGGFDLGLDVMALDAVLRDVPLAYAVDPARVYYHGFSAGAHWGYAVVLANANLFAALGVSAGSLTVAIQQGVFPGQVQRRLPVAIRHGVQDTVVPVQAARDDRARLAQAGHVVALEELPRGHTVDADDARALWAFFRQHVR